MSDHARFPPSASERWLRCTSSITLTEKLVEEGTISVSRSTHYSARGTAAHGVGAECLRKGWDAERVVRDRKNLTQWCEKPEDRACVQDMQFDAEDLAAIQFYVDAVRFTRQLRGSHTMRVERRLTITSELWGSSDCVLEPDELVEPADVFDYKHGSGVGVNVVNNYQLMLYAAGLLAEVKTLPGAYLHIVQPRFERGRPWQTWYVDRDAIKRLVHRALAAIDVAASGDPSYVPGPWCEWCPVAGVCAPRAEHAQRAVLRDFAPDTLTIEQVAEVLAVKPAVEQWLKDVEAHALSNAIDFGRVPPGFKVVARRGHRAWRNEAQAKQMLMRELGEQAFAPLKLITPHAAERLQVDKDVVAQYAHTPAEDHPQPVLVPDGDKREALVDFEFADLKSSTPWEEAE